MYIYSIVVAGNTQVLFHETCDKSTAIDKEGSFVAQWINEYIYIIIIIKNIYKE